MIMKSYRVSAVSRLKALLQTTVEVQMSRWPSLFFAVKLKAAHDSLRQGHPLWQLTLRDGTAQHFAMSNKWGGILFDKNEAPGGRLRMEGVLQPRKHGTQGLTFQFMSGYAQHLLFWEKEAKFGFSLDYKERGLNTQL